jgi:hypothetical protein
MYNENKYVIRAHKELGYDEERHIYLFKEKEELKFTDPIEEELYNNFRIELLVKIYLTFDLTYEVLNDILNILIESDNEDEISDRIYENEIIYYSDGIRKLNDLNFFGLVDEKIKEKTYDDLMQCINIAYAELLEEKLYEVKNYIDEFISDNEEEED